MNNRSAVKRKLPVPEFVLDSGLRIFESRHEDSFSMAPRQHAFPELLFFYEGQGRVEFWESPKRKKSVACSAGDCVIVPAKTDHSIVDDSEAPFALFGLAVDPKIISVSQPLADLLPSGKLPRERMLTLDAETRIRRLLYLASEANALSMLTAVAEALDLLVRIAGTPKKARSGRKDIGHEQIDAYLAWLTNHFFESLTLEDAAKSCAMSRRKFTELFRVRTGKTWLQYVQCLRIQHAIRLLQESDSKVASIAFQAGFDEVSTFYRVFKRVTGKQPLEFRT
ncbi:MAG: AraC family transcriptional regulator [Planctomycetota bacterium]